MSVDELIDLAKELPRVDQIRLAQFLAETEYERREREFVNSFEGVTEIQIWSPHDSYETAAAMLRLRAEAEKKQ